MRRKHLDPPHHLSCIQPSLALPYRAASLKLAGTARYPLPDLSRELDAAWHRTAGLSTCLGTRTGRATAVLTDRLPRCQGLFSPWAFYLDAPVCESTAGPMPWKTSVPSQPLPTRAPTAGSSAQPLSAPAAAKNTGQLLCHNLIAALFTRNVN